jgi:hypothetical protein
VLIVPNRRTATDRAEALRNVLAHGISDLSATYHRLDHEEVACRLEGLAELARVVREMATGLSHPGADPNANGAALAKLP